MTKGLVKAVSTKTVSPVAKPIVAKGLNRGQLIEVVAKKNNITKAQADAVIGSVIDAIQTTVKKGQTVKLVGFGTFKRVTRKARLGVNPKTKVQIKIAKKTVPKFTASKTWLVK